MDSKVIVTVLRNAALAALSVGDLEQFMAVCDLTIFLESQHIVRQEDIDEIMGKAR